MKRFSPKIELSEQEKGQLSSVKPKIGLKDVLQFSIKELSEATGIIEVRCEEIIALVQFQLLGSVSKAASGDLWRLGFKRLDQLENADPVEMYNDFSKLVGTKVDPCVEDVFRCAVAQVKAALVAKDFTQYKHWWLFKDQRGKSEVILEDVPNFSELSKEHSDHSHAKL